MLPLEATLSLGNAHKLRLLSRPKGGLLDVVFVAQFSKISFWLFLGFYLYVIDQIVSTDV